MAKLLPTIFTFILAGALIYWVIKALTSLVVAFAPILVTALVFFIVSNILERTKKG